MIVNKAYRYRIYPMDAQEVFSQKPLVVSVLFIMSCNMTKQSTMKNQVKMLKNTPAQYKNKHEFLKEVDSLALVHAQLNL